MKDKFKPDLHKILRHYGNPAQTIKCIEELSELTKELCKDLNRQNQSLDPLISEIADVLIMVEQIKIMIGLRDWDLNIIINSKIERTKAKIREEKYVISKQFKN